MKWNEPSPPWAPARRCDNGVCVDGQRLGPKPPNPSPGRKPSPDLGPPRLPGAMEHTVSAPDYPCDDGGICGDDCTGSTCWGPFRRWGAVRQDPYCLWFRGEYLLWWMKESPIPPLVTTSPFGTPRELAGVLG